MDILELINEATKEADAFEHHPAKDLTLEERLLYLQGLALVMNVDGDVHEDEKEYLRILIKSFDMDESTLGDFVEFAHSPDKDTVQAFFRTFRRRPVAQLFFFDALMMSRRDGKVDDREHAIIDSLADKLEILKGTQEDIFDLFCYIKNRNWRESALYFNSHLLNPDHFKHLLAYHELEYDQLMEETSQLRAERILQVLKSKMPPLTPGEKVKPKINHDVAIPLLQSDLDRGQASVVGGVYSLEHGLGKLELRLQECGIGYDKEHNGLFKASDADLGAAAKYVGERLVDATAIVSAKEVFELLYGSAVKIPKAKVAEDDPRKIVMLGGYVDRSFPYLELEGRVLKVTQRSSFSMFDKPFYDLADEYSSQNRRITVQYNERDSDVIGYFVNPEMSKLLKKVFFTGVDISSDGENDLKSKSMEAVLRGMRI